MNEREKIIDTIKKCLALGDKSRNPSEHEAETAIARAKSLMDQYNLSMADVAQSDAHVLGKIIEQTMTPRSSPPNWEIDIAAVCNTLFSTYSYTNRGWRKDSVVFVGYETDVAIAVEVYKLLKLELLALARRWEEADVKWSAGDASYGGSYNPTPAMRRTRKFKYLDGVVWTLLARARKLSETMTAEQNAKVTGLVVRKSNDAKQWAEAKHNLKPAIRRESDLHGDALSAGLKDGNQVGLDFKNKVPSNRPKPLQLGGGK